MKILNLDKKNQQQQREVKWFVYTRWKSVYCLLCNESPMVREMSINTVIIMF